MVPNIILRKIFLSNNSRQPTVRFMNNFPHHFSQYCNISIMSVLRTNFLYAYEIKQCNAQFTKLQLQPGLLVSQIKGQIQLSILVQIDLGSQYTPA